MKFDLLRVCRDVLRQTAIAVVAVGLCAALASVASAQESRTWTDATGKFKVKAKFIEMADGKVTLERADGTQISIPLGKLSKADQDVVKELQSDDQDPFKAVKPKSKTRRTRKIAEEPRDDAENEESMGDGPKVVKPDWSDAKQILLAGTDGKWSLSIEAPKQPAADKRRAIALPPKRDFFEGCRGVFINPVCRRAAIAYSLERPGGNDERQLRIVLCDLDKGKLLSTIKTSGKLVPLALNDAGADILVCRDEWGWGKHDRLEIWRLTGSRVSKVLQWIPHGDQNGGERDIHWARFIGDDKLVTASGGGKLTIWNAKTAEPLAWLKIAGGCHPALSPDRKYLAFGTDKEIGVLDLANDELIALEPAPKEHLFNPVLAFTPKGKRLVCASQDRIFVFDSATGALYREISLSGANVHVGENVLCPSEEHVLVGNSLLIDMESQAKVWTYRGHESVNILDGVCWFQVAGDNAGVLVSSVLPHPGAVEKIRKILESPDFFVLKPGVTVKLNADAIQDPGEREKAAAALTKQLQANGFQIGPNGTVELAATTEMGKRRDIAYHTFGQPGAREFSFQEYTSRVKLIYNGQTAWEVCCGNVPGFVQLKEGETMQQFLQRNERPNYEWFSHVELPKLVQKPSPGGATLGTTEVTTSGLR